MRCHSDNGKKIAPLAHMGRWRYVRGQLYDCLPEIPESRPGLFIIRSGQVCISSKQSIAQKKKHRRNRIIERVWFTLHQIRLRTVHGSFSVPVFRGCSAYSIKSRLRYSIVCDRLLLCRNSFFALYYHHFTPSNSQETVSSSRYSCVPIGFPS